jgi:hypothetical protein
VLGDQEQTEIVLVSSCLVLMTPKSRASFISDDPQIPQVTQLSLPQVFELSMGDLIVDRNAGRDRNFVKVHP